MSRLRRLLRSGCYFLVTSNVWRPSLRRAQASRSARPVALLGGSEFLLLANAVRRARCALQFRLTAWVFLPDHWHAIIFPQQPATISDIMKLIKERSNYEIGLGRGNCRRLWQPRYYERVLRTVKEYQDAVAYIHMNPVARGLVAKPRDWPWSSIHDYGGSAESVLTTDRVDLPSDENARLV